MSTFKVNIKDAATGNGVGCVKVEAADKEAAVIEAKKAMVRSAKAYNAKYQGQVADWQIRSENHDDYSAWGTTRKMPSKKVAA